MDPDPTRVTLTYALTTLFARYLNWLSKEEVESILRPEPKHMANAIGLVKRHGGSVEQLIGSDKIVVNFSEGTPPPAFMRELMVTEGVEAHLDFDLESWAKPRTRSVECMTA